MLDIRHVLIACALLFLAPFAEAAPTVAIDANPKTGVAPYPSTVTWSSTGASGCTASDGWTGTKTLSGTQSVSVTAATKYTLKCVANDGVGHITWIAPTKNTDGSTLTDLAGFKVYRGATLTNLALVATISDPATLTYDDTGLAAGTYVYAVTAFNAGGFASERNANPPTMTALVSSTTASVPVAVQTIPAPPTGVTAEAIVAFEIRTNSSGVLTAAQIGVLPADAVCGAETKQVGTVTYNRVDTRLVDFTSVPSKLKPVEAWARCPGA